MSGNDGQKSGHLSEMENNPFEGITCIPVPELLFKSVGCTHNILMWCLSVACSLCGCVCSFFCEIIVEHAASVLIQALQVIWTLRISRK